jgi:2-polyprenyl-3-methyl-5-hydroxy-6-metoxy-1,4-benzoquinol methylase
MAIPHQTPSPRTMTTHADLNRLGPSRRPGGQLEREAAWNRLLLRYPADSWFRTDHLPENRPRILRILKDLAELVPPDLAAPVMDVGCFNGFLCFLLHELGFSVSGMDALADEQVPERQALLEQLKAPFYLANFNHLDPFPDCPRNHFAALVLGEVFEHLLNHPQGFLEQLRELLLPGGILILTTPNPCTVMNAARFLQGKSGLWGDTEFARMPKIDAQNRIISFPDIHYREYAQSSLVQVMELAGFEILRAEYLGNAATARHSPFVQRLKSSGLWTWLQSHRLLGAGQYVVARRPLREILTHR